MLPKELLDLKANLVPNKIYSSKSYIYENDLDAMAICLMLPFMHEFVEKYWVCEGRERYYYNYGFDKHEKIVYTYDREINEYTLQLIKGE